MDENKRRDVLGDLKNFFDDQIQQLGPVPASLSYSTRERQQLCFSQLMKVWQDPTQPATLLDYGCGYGPLIDYLEENGYQIAKYTGYDMSKPMVDQAIQRYGDRPYVHFTTDESTLKPVDYIIASGVLGMKMNIDHDTWTEHILSLLDRLWPLAQYGMSFNSLTKYSDADKLRDDLYYADPCVYFDHCKRHYSRNVALLHDYGVYEFTIIVRGDARL